VLLLAAAACHTPVVSMSVPATAPAAKEYPYEVLRWTRHGHVRFDFDEALTVNATLHSPEFRAAYTEKWVSQFSLVGAEAEKIRSDFAAEVADCWEVHLESASHTHDEDNFKPERHLWHLALVTDQGRQVSASEIKLDKEKRDVATALYPHATVFSRGWRIRFPRRLADGLPLIEAGTRSLTLRIAGPHGSTDIVWRLSGS